MKKCLTLLVLFFSIVSAEAVELEYLRKQYGKAVEDAELCKVLISAVSKKEGEAVYLGYLGALQAVWAEHARGPIAKLQTFNTGKSNIEKAIAQSPNNVELRAVRLSIQRNCPRFLGYRSNIAEDTSYIKKSLPRITSEPLREMCLTLIEE